MIIESLNISLKLLLPLFISLTERAAAAEKEVQHMLVFDIVEKVCRSTGPPKVTSLD